MTEPRSPRFLERYLLGDVAPEARTQFEDEYMGDDVMLEQLLAAEADLVDAYARGALSSADRERFERCFLVTARRRERLAFAQSLQRVVSAGKTAEPRRARVPAVARLLRVAAVLMLGLAGGALYMRYAATPEPVHVVAVHVVHAGATRQSGAVASIRLPKEEGLVEFQLLLEAGAPFARYRAYLEDETGKTRWTSDPLATMTHPSGRPAVSSRIPTRLLGSGAYAIRLFGVAEGGAEEAFEEYLLRVESGARGDSGLPPTGR